LVENVVESWDDPLLQVTEALSAGEAIADGVAFTFGVLSRIELFDLLETECLPHSGINLPKPAFLVNWQTGSFCDGLSRVQTSPEVAAMCGVKADRA
jgi:hypothetical protein